MNFLQSLQLSESSLAKCYLRKKQPLQHSPVLSSPLTLFSWLWAGQGRSVQSLALTILLPVSFSSLRCWGMGTCQPRVPLGSPRGMSNGGLEGLKNVCIGTSGFKPKLISAGRSDEIESTHTQCFVSAALRWYRVKRLPLFGKVPEDSLIFTPILVCGWLYS